MLARADAVGQSTDLWTSKNLLLTGIFFLYDALRLRRFAFGVPSGSEEPGSGKPDRLTIDHDSLPSRAAL
jgi:hypothetical protein